MKESVEPAVGQVWADNDPRSAGRQVKIVEVVRDVSRPYAVVRSASNPSGRQTRIQLTRFRDVASGYKFVQDSSAQF